MDPYDHPNWKAPNSRNDLNVKSLSNQHQVQDTNDIFTCNKGPCWILKKVDVMNFENCVELEQIIK